MSPPHKRRRLSSLSSSGRDDESESEQQASHDDERQASLSSPDTADEIENLKFQKSKKTAKRKIRATGATAFGATLQSLLNTDTPSSLPLALKPSATKKRKAEELEKKAKRVLHVERRDKEDKNRIREVIEGWGGESERALRKVAQRGVVKLFNAIQRAQASAEAAEEEKKAQRGSGKPTLAAPDIDGGKKHKKKGKSKDNVLGKNAVGKDEFFDLIKSGGIVSKA